MGETLKHKTIHGLSWSFLESVAQQGVRFIIGIALARLLLPEQFGLIGMLLIFMAVAQSFLDGGFKAALIQKPDVTHADTCSIFFFNIVVGLAAAGLLCLIAPWIATFYNQPMLTPLARALSLTIVINSFGLIQGALLLREINFKTQTKVSLISSLMSGVIAVTFAATGFGVWSLVAQQVSAALFSTVTLWVLSSWRPMPIFRFDALRQMFGFGSRLLFSSLLNQIFDNIYLAVIGKVFTVADLGYFTRATTLQGVPTGTLSGMVGRVTFPVFSTIQDDPARLKRGVRKALTMLALVSFPMLIGLAVVARPLVLMLLTDKWAGCIQYFQLLCFAGLLDSTHVINLNVLQALGRSDLFLRLEIIKKVLIVLNIVVTVQWGITAMIGGMIGLTIIGYYLNTRYTHKLIDYPFWEQLHDLSPYFVTAMLMGAGMYAVAFLPLTSYLSTLLIEAALGAATYAVLCRIFRLAAFMEIWQSVSHGTRFLALA